MGETIKKGGDTMEIEERKELLETLPGEDYLDKLIEAAAALKHIEESEIDEEYLDKIIEARSVDFEK